MCMSACKDIQYSLLISASRIDNVFVKDPQSVLPLLIPVIIVVDVRIISVLVRISFVVVRIIFVIVRTIFRQCKSYLRSCKIYLRRCKKIWRKASHVPRLWATNQTTQE